jgi:hypothetical protein
VGRGGRLEVPAGGRGPSATSGWSACGPLARLRPQAASKRLGAQGAARRARRRRCRGVRSSLSALLGEDGGVESVWLKPAAILRPWRCPRHTGQVWHRRTPPPWRPLRSRWDHCSRELLRVPVHEVLAEARERAQPWPRAPSGADPKVRVLTRWRPRQDSNLRTRLRRPVLYPLSYEGVARRGYSTVGCGRDRRERQGGQRRRFVDRAEGRRHPRGARPPVPDRLGLSTGAGRRRSPRAGRERPTKPATIGNCEALAEAESGSRKAHGRAWAFPVVAGGGATRRWPTRGGSEEGWR